MAITISGENNNDRILAADGVIDQISGINFSGIITASHINVGSNIQLGNAGIITATTFVGNVTGNVNSTSPLLLQTGGSERFRITGNNELGIAGANYGSAGQVLTSGGSGNAVSWTTIPTQVTITGNADNRVITGGSGTNLNGESTLTYDGTTFKVGQAGTGGALAVRGSANSTQASFSDNTSGTLRIATATGALNLLLVESGQSLVYGIGDLSGLSTEYLRIKSDGGMRLQKSDGNGNFTISRNASVTTTDQPIGVVDFASNTAHTVQARIMGKTLGTSNVGGDLVVETRAEGGSLDERVRIKGDGRVYIGASSGGNADTDDIVISGSGKKGITLCSTDGSESRLTFADGLSGISAVAGSVLYTHSNNSLDFYTATTRRLRISGTGPQLFLGGITSVNEITETSTQSGIVIGNTSMGNGGLAIINSTSGTGRIYFGDATGSDTARNRGQINYYHNGDYMLFATAGDERLRISNTGNVTMTATGDPVLTITGPGHAQLTLTNTSGADHTEINFGDSDDHDAGAIRYTNSTNNMQFDTNGVPNRMVITSDGNVGIARTTNNAQTSSTDSLYNLSINRESVGGAYDGLCKSLNVDNQYTVQTFRAINTNRNSTVGWMDIAHFRAWDINARVIIQAGGTFTGDQINIDLQSSYNSALNTGRAGPVLEVKRTEGHTGQRFTKVRLGCAANRQPILQVYFDGSKTHNSNGSITVTVHDYGSNYGQGQHRGEAKFETGTTLTETFESLDIDEAHCDYFNTSTTPAFSAYRDNPASQIAAGVYTFDDQILDRGGNNYNTGNGKFTAPCDGVYYFIATLQMYGDNGSGTHARFQKNGVDIYNNGTNTPTYDERAGSHHSLTMFALVQLSTDDYVECVRSNTTRGMQSAIAGFLVR